MFFRSVARARSTSSFVIGAAPAAASSVCEHGRRARRSSGLVLAHLGVEHHEARLVELP